MRRFALALLALPLFSVDFQPIQSDGDTQKVVDFLTNRDGKCGLTYEADAGMLRGLRLCQSYYSTVNYFGTYVGNIKGNNLQVTDVYNASTQTISPDNHSPGATLQRERVRVYTGTNIKDAALWQMALAVHGKAKDDLSYFEQADGQNELLYWAYDGKEPEFRIGDNRAFTQGGKYKYNNQHVSSIGSSYVFSQLGMSKMSTDPFKGTTFTRFINAKNFPAPYETGDLSWFDFRPFTKEIAWAFILAPIKSALLKQEATKAQHVPHTDPLVENCLYLIDTLRTMQSAIGGVYETCSGVKDPESGQTINANIVSIEANAILLSGLLNVRRMFTDILTYDQAVSEEMRGELSRARDTIDLMIDGNKKKKGEGGLIAFFSLYAASWDGHFYESGIVSGTQWTPNDKVQSASANIYGLSAMGQLVYDNIRGFGGSLELWEKIKGTFGFYGPKGELWGFGFTNQDGNGLKVKARAQVLSTENTMAALNLLRILIRQYTSAQTSPFYTREEQIKAKSIVSTLETDYKALVGKLLALRTDNYVKEPVFRGVIPKNYTKLIPMQSDRLGFVEASKRYLDPISGQKNPIPHTGSTAWMILLQYDFNPIEPVMIAGQ